MQSALFFLFTCALTLGACSDRDPVSANQPTEGGRQAQNQQHNSDQCPRRRAGRVAVLPARRGRGPCRFAHCSRSPARRRWAGRCATA